jgi:uncharacterized protein
LIGMAAPRLFWLGEDDTALACVSWGPADPVATLVVVPAFAEEMNRCRRWLARTAALLATRDIQTLIYDLPGTGDSPRPFAAASWAGWIQATRRAMTWAQTFGPTHLLGVRSGALLAAASLDGSAVPLLLASPVKDGESAIRGLLRVGDAAALAMALRQSGRVDVGGYTLTRELAFEISKAKLDELLATLLAPVTRLDLSGLPHPWLQIEPDEPEVLAETTATQIFDAMAGPA